ncbi:unnamed protein product [Dicrocoelium dendriticum]|nr:unnamed protein product [Dicrocoelium dendriticum]
MRFSQSLLLIPVRFFQVGTPFSYVGYPEADGKCKIDFFSYSDDNAHLFVAVRFASHNVARKLINRYDGERIFGHRVEINWFKDIRKARKKVIENKRKYQALLAQPHSECRRRFTSRFQPWRMNNRWNCNRASYRHFGSPTLRQCVSSGNSSESRSCSPPFRTRDRSTSKRSSSSSSSSTTSKESNQSKKFGRRSQKAYSTDSLSSSTLSMRSPTSGPKRTMRIPPYHYDEHTSEKEILQAALDACPIASEQNYRYSRSVSRHSKQQEPAIPTRQNSKSEHTTTPKDTIQRRKKHQKRKKRRRDRHSSSYRGKRSSASPCPELFDHKKTPEQNYSPPTNVTEIQDEDVHAMLEVEELSLEATNSQRKLHQVLSPRAPVQSRSSSEAEAGSSRSPEQEFPSTASVVAIEIPKMDQSSTEITETPLSPHDQSSENETKNFTIDLDVPEEGITEPVSKVDVGTQYLCSLSESNGE